MLVRARLLILDTVCDGAEGMFSADLARSIDARNGAPATSAVVFCRDGSRMAALARSLSFFAPEIEVLQFPAWDCLPYDRVSPHAAIVAQRMTVLSRLAPVKGGRNPAVLPSTLHAAPQRVPTRDQLPKQAFSADPRNL